MVAERVSNEGGLPTARAGRAAVAVQVARQVGRNLLRTAAKAQRVRRDLTQVAQVTAADRRRAVVKGKQVVDDAKVLLKQARRTVDPNEIIGGFAGLTAGEVVGGAVGGIAGTIVGGPAGAIVGAEVGAFTGGMLGVKLGTDAVRDFGGTPDVSPPALSAEMNGEQTDYDKAKRPTRIGEIVGLTSGASVGRIVAGPIGGVAGGILGEAIGGQVGKEAKNVRAEPAASSPPKPMRSVADIANRAGKNMAGEAATVLVGTLIGSVFGPSGRTAGRRLGFVLGRQIAWDKLNLSRADELAAGVPTTITVRSLSGGQTASKVNPEIPKNTDGAGV
jgi:hypothetical protein